MRDAPHPIDRIYEAAAVPTSWPIVIDSMSGDVGGNGGFLFASRSAYGQHTARPSLDETFDRLMTEDDADCEHTRAMLAEARVPRGIGEAQPIEEVAELQGVPRETARSQIKAVLTKTGLGRQSELVSLLAGAGRTVHDRKQLR